MTTPTRYKQPHMTPHPQGEWVSWEEHERIVGALVLQLGRQVLKNVELSARLEPGFVAVDANGNAHFSETKA